MNKIRLENESQHDFANRMLKHGEKKNSEELRIKHMMKNNSVATNLAKTNKIQNLVTPLCNDQYFDLFVGFWQLDTIDDFDHETLMELYRDSEQNPRAHFYDGTQNNFREVNVNDEFSIFNPVSPAGNDIPVEVIGFKSIRFINNSVHLSTDDLTSTMRIQDNDDNVGICQFFTDWDGSADNAAYGSVENVSKFLRLPSRPNIQLNSLPSPIDWTNPVNIMKYVAEFYNYLGMPQKAVSLQQNNYIGWLQAENLLNTYLTTGVKRCAKVSDKKKAGKYIGVWKTQFPLDYPVTTIHTQEFHHMNAASTVTISGFKKHFKVLNGVHTVSALPPSVSLSTPEPWQFHESTQHYIHINYDSSNICEEYDPCVHGIAHIEALHGPVTPITEYRDFAAALFDFSVTVWGPGTHSRIRFWINDSFNIVNTFAELKAGIADDTLGILTNNFRTYTANVSANAYHNPYILGGNIRFPTVNINDPYHLGEMDFDPNFDYDIDIENYLSKCHRYSLFFTVTGPTNPNEPITEQLTSFGYPCNGSQVVFKTNTFGVFPPPLVDTYGSHDWLLFAAADNDPGTIEYSKYHNYVHGIIDKKYTGCKTVGYIRIGDCDSFDSPMLLLTTRSLAFGRSDMPNNQIKSNYIAGLATVIENLNRCNPDRIIIDMRNNGGGFAHIPSAIGSVFGGNRVGLTNQIAYAGNGQRDPLEINGCGLQTVYNSLQQNSETDEFLDIDAVAAIFPNGVFRGNCTGKKEIIVLTNSHAASAGDMLPHAFIGSDPNATVHDIGHNTFARIVGDIDGRLWSGVKGYDGVALDPLNYNLSNSNEPRTCVYLACEAGLLYSDRLGTLVNEQTWTQPNVLLPSWYDTTIWQDLGLTHPNKKYPLCKHEKRSPKFCDRSTWRDIHLEYAIKK